MATVTADFSQLKIFIGDGVTPTEGFTEFCMVNMSRNFSKTAATEDDEVPNCSDVTDPASILRQVRSVDYNVGGEGKLHQTDLATALAWCGGAAKNVRIEIGTVAGGGYRVAGSFLMTAFEITGSFKQTLSANITLVPADSGAVTETALA